LVERLPQDVELESASMSEKTKTREETHTKKKNQIGGGGGWKRGSIAGEGEKKSPKLGTKKG